MPPSRSRMELASLAAAVVGSLSPGHAAEAPKWEAATLPMLQLCPNNGFKISATGACIRIGGQVRSDATMSAGSAAMKAFRRDMTHLHAEGRVTVDVRQPTELGPVRAVVSVRSRKDGGGALDR